MAGGAVVNVGIAPTTNPTTKRIGDFLADITLPVGAHFDPSKVRAATAYTMALDWLIMTNWEYYHTRGTAFATAGNTPDYVVPTRIKTIYNMRIATGNPRPLFYVREDEYDRARWDQTANDLPTHYTLSVLHQQSVLTLLPTPSGVETVSFDMYRDPDRTTDPAATPNIATYMELPLILYGLWLVTKWKGRPDANDFFSAAEAARHEALERD